MAINGFEKETHKLTAEEKRLVRPVVELIEARTSKQLSIKNHEIAERIVSKGYCEKLPASRVRKLIHHIRVNRILDGIIATSKGYYVTKDRIEVKSYLESLKQREEAIKEVRHSTAVFYASLLEQGKLF